MENLGLVEKDLGMKIVRDIKAKKLCLSHEKYQGDQNVQHEK